MKSPLAIARDSYLEYQGKVLWSEPWPTHWTYARNRIERAWLDGVQFAVVASVDIRSKVPAPGWMKGKP